MTLPLITKASPPRYFISGAESDSDDSVDEKLVEEVKTVEVAESIFAQQKDKSATRIELRISFKNPFKRTNATQKVRVNATNYTFDRQRERIECLFDFSEAREPIFFTHNADARTSKVSAIVTGYKSHKDPIVIDEFTSYIKLDPGSAHTIASDNLHFRARLEALTDKQKQKLTGAKRRLDFSGDDTSQASSDNAERFHNIFVLAQAELVIQLR